MAFCKMPIFTRLILLIHQQGRSFHLLMSFSISYFRDSKFLSCRSSACLELYQGILYFCGDSEKRCFPNFFLCPLIFPIKHCYSCELILCPATLLSMCISSRSCLVKIFVSRTYTIISSLKRNTWTSFSPIMFRCIPSIHLFKTFSMKELAGCASVVPNMKRMGGISPGFSWVQESLLGKAGRVWDRRLSSWESALLTSAGSPLGFIRVNIFMTNNRLHSIAPGLTATQFFCN